MALREVEGRVEVSAAVLGRAERERRVEIPARRRSPRQPLQLEGVGRGGPVHGLIIERIGQVHDTRVGEVDGLAKRGVRWASTYNEARRQERHQSRHAHGNSSRTSGTPCTSSLAHPSHHPHLSHLESVRSWSNCSTSVGALYRPGRMDRSRLPEVPSCADA
jgi:hypothetical protein